MIRKLLLLLLVALTFAAPVSAAGVLNIDIYGPGQTRVNLFIAEALAKEGAKRIFAACTHPILSGPALDRIAKSKLERIFVTNTIPLKDKAVSSGAFTVLSVAELFGEAIRRINEGSSVSSLFV